MHKTEYSWEETVELLGQDPVHQKLIYDSYLTADLFNNCQRFFLSDEFNATLEIIKNKFPHANKILDMPAGNGIASFAFAKSGFKVTAVEPDKSNLIGRGAIEFVKQKENLANLEIVSGWGENLPVENSSFDVVYVRQGLHHAANLETMMKEIARVLKNGGCFFACREPVVDDYKESLQSFLSSQVDHQLYGGENAFTLPDYLKAIKGAGLKLILVFDQYDSIINLYPSDYDHLKRELLNSRSGKLLKIILPDNLVYKITLSKLKLIKNPGRLYGFIAVKP